MEDSILSKPTRSTTKRTTVEMPLSLHENLEVFLVRSGGSKNQLIEKVLAEFLAQQGFRPYERPKVTVSY